MSNLPTTMNALVVNEFGSPDVLKYTTVPVPQLQHPTDMLVKVMASGVNPIEAKMRQGNLFAFLVKPPAILGADYSGVVVAKGSQVTEFQVNDAVFGTLHGPAGPHGTYAEYVVVNTAVDKAVAKKPTKVSFVDAASVGLAGLTALEGVLRCDKPGKVLVIGASGGVGIYGVQIAKAVGAHVVAICSGKNSAMVKEFGADDVVDYHDQAAMDALAQGNKNSFDVVLDLVGGDGYYNMGMPLVKEKTGIFVTASGPTEHSGSTRVGLWDYLSIGGTILYRRLFASRRYDMILTLPHDKFASVLAPMVDRHQVKCLVPRENVFDLKDGALAHKKIESLRTTGKLVLRVSPDV
ncbi:chaperonin 10-like protein [Chlamydoabsidia padenii]|nr:chaperonin 10-like protein [Chlamydoabsidia padenii]